MLEHLEVYRDMGLPTSVAGIPLPETVRSLPYIRFVAEALCENPADKEALQQTLWQLDAMPTGEICDHYDDFQAQLAAGAAS